MSRLGQKIKEIRTVKGLSPKALGKKVGVSESFILDVESGRKILNENLTTRLSKVLDTNLNEAGSFYSSSTDEGTEKTSRAETTKSAVVKAEKRPLTPEWEHAFLNIITDLPVYDQNMSKVLYSKKQVLEDNKVESIPYDKAFYIQIQNANKNTHWFKKGDLVLIHKQTEILGAGIYLINYQNSLRICEVKPLNRSLVLLVSSQTTLATETAAAADIAVIGKCIKAEVYL